MKAQHQQSGLAAKGHLGFSRGKKRAQVKGRPEGTSLKQAMKELIANPLVNDEVKALQAAAKRWLHNKRCNTQAPQKGIGRTNRIKKAGPSGKK